MEVDQNETIKQLRLENEKLKEQLKKYTAPLRNKRYYEANKEKIQRQQKEYREKLAISAFIS